MHIKYCIVYYTCYRPYIMYLPQLSTIYSVFCVIAHYSIQSPCILCFAALRAGASKHLSFSSRHARPVIDCARSEHSERDGDTTGIPGSLASVHISLCYTGMVRILKVNKIHVERLQYRTEKGFMLLCLLLQGSGVPWVVGGACES